jgi:hypothetical protein
MVENRVNFSNLNPTGGGNLELKQTIVTITDQNLRYVLPCDRIKKNQSRQKWWFDQSKHQNSTIQVTRFFFIRSHATCQ